MLIWLPALLILLAYGGLMLWYRQGWARIAPFAAGDTSAQTIVTVLVPVRNEAAHIARLLECLQQQDYPAQLRQIIVIDDASDDDTRSIVQAYEGMELVVLDNKITQSHKKRAIEAGLALARGQWIVTTDGDCEMGPHWLSSIMAFQEKSQSCYVAAPVVMHSNGRFLQNFQQMDFAVLQGVTAVSVHSRLHAMSNGANQAYTRAAFDAVNGFENIDHIASGDDMLLLQKINRCFPRQVGWLHSADAIVRTAPAESWSAFFQQRIRWASKARHYTEGPIFLVMLLVYLVNLCFPLLLIASIWNIWFLLAALLFWLGKSLLEWPFVRGVFRFFALPVGLVRFFLFQPVHMLYTVVSGFLGLIGKYEWKGRKAK